MKHAFSLLALTLFCASAQANVVKIPVNDSGTIGSGNIVVTYEVSPGSANYVQILFEKDSTMVGFENGLDATIVQHVSHMTGTGGLRDDSSTIKIPMSCDTSDVGVCHGLIARFGLELASPSNFGLSHTLSIEKDGQPVKFSDGTDAIHIVLPNQ